MKRSKNPGSAQVGSIFLLKETLDYFLQNAVPADRALNETFRKYKIRDERIRSELARRLYGLIRSWRPLVTALGKDSFETVNELKVLVDTWNTWRRIYKGEKADTKDAVTDRLSKYLRVRKLRESFPDWLDQRAEDELGKSSWDAVSHALNEEPVIFLRANTLRATREEVLKRLRAEEIAVQPADTDEAVLLEEFRNVFASPAYREGLFEVQDLSSQQVSPFLDVAPGMRVADACAGNGGKTLHLASLMQNRGKIIAMDISAKKIEELRSRCARAGADLVETKLVERNKPLKRLDGTFDRVLLDVPCSGTGVLRRNPDIRWRLAPDDLDNMMREQKEILNTYAPLVKPGGKLVYATCSILPSEGENQVKNFLEAHPETWKLEKELRIDPSLSPGDGFYMARLKKIEAPGKLPV
jgi:16S rRNA (cytosine967-C5)-methyltransferase